MNIDDVGLTRANVSGFMPLRLITPAEPATADSGAMIATATTTMPVAAL